MRNILLLSFVVGVSMLASPALSAQGLAQEAARISAVDAVPSALAGGFSCPNGGSLLINQQPNQSNGIFADSDCSLCGTGQQSVAGDFVLNVDTTVAQLVFWGGYFPANQIPDPPDAINVIFHQDAAGLPGAVIDAQNLVPTSATQTGVVLFGVNEILYVVDLNPVAFPVGTFWMEIFTNSVGNSDQFFWEVGDLDPVNGRDGTVFATATPGVTWTATAAQNFAFALCGQGTFSIGGTVSGLVGSGLVLQNNGGDDLPIAADGPFTFATVLPDLSAYEVTVLSDPGTPSQTCTVTNGAGNLSGADVTNVEVNCVTDSFTVGGTVSGLAGSGLVLQNNGGDDLSISTDGGFSFPTALEDGSTYEVTVLTQPSDLNQICTVINGSGTIADVDVTDIEVDCVTNQYTVGGNVTGLAGTGLVLRNNGGDDLSISADGSFSFPTALEDGNAYEVTVLTQPDSPSQSCQVLNGSGTLAGSDVGTVVVECLGDELFEDRFEML